MLAIACAGVINFFFIINAHVPSASMEPTLNSGCFVIGNRLAYLSESPQLGDVVFFKKDDVSPSLLVKRIVALPGMRFAMKDGKVYLNGEPIDEEYIDELGDSDYDEITVPDGCYLVLGDNRRESNDSRYWQDPFVKQDQIKAKATLVWFPEFKNIYTE